MARHVDGDEAAFGVLVARHRDRLWAVALRTLHDPDEAADALQDALVSAFRRAGSYRGDAAVTTWLHRIVVNACLDRARRQAVRRTDPLTDDHGHERVPSTPPDSVESVAEDSARRDAVLAALRALPVKQRAALVLVDMEGYSVSEAAHLLDCPTGTVKSRCSRGRASLLPLLGAWAPSAGGAAVTEPLPAPTRPTRKAGTPDDGVDTDTAVSTGRPPQPEQEVT